MVSEGFPLEHVRTNRTEIEGQKVLDHIVPSSTKFRNILRFFAICWSLRIFLGKLLFDLRYIVKK